MGRRDSNRPFSIRDLYQVCTHILLHTLKQEIKLKTERKFNKSHLILFEQKRVFLKNFQNSLSQHICAGFSSIFSQLFPLLSQLSTPLTNKHTFPQKYYTRRTKEKTFTVHLSFAVVDKFSTTHSIVPFHRCIVSLGFSTEGATAPRLCFLVWNVAAGCCVLVWLRCVLFSTTAFYV